MPATVVRVCSITLLYVLLTIKNRLWLWLFIHARAWWGVLGLIFIWLEGKFDDEMVLFFVIGMVGLCVCFCLLMTLIVRADNAYSFVGGLAIFGCVAHHTNISIHAHTTLIMLLRTTAIKIRLLDVILIFKCYFIQGGLPPWLLGCDHSSSQRSWHAPDCYHCASSGEINN
jgi:hypothetical protein